MFGRQSKIQPANAIVSSELFDETTFYLKFMQDVENCQQELIIESPFITSERTNRFIPLFKRLLERNVEIYILTRDPREHDENLAVQAEQEIVKFEKLGVNTFLCKGNDHRKLAILDRTILWEGSLNILSQTKSREIMRRIVGKEIALNMFDFIHLKKYIQTSF